MAKTTNNLNSLINSLGKGGSVPGVGAKLPPASAGSVNLGSSGSKTQSLSSAKMSAGITFGRPSSTKTTTSSSGTDWGKLLEQTASGGGLSSLLSGGGFSLGSLTGIGSIISTISNLFGGKKTLAPLQRFTLPAAQNATISVSSNGNSGTTVATNGQVNTAQIAQAVKTALLHSSSLNDVISEI